MFRPLIFLAFLFSAFLPLPISAQPMVFTRENLNIVSIRQPAPELKGKKGEEKTEENKKSATEEKEAEPAEPITVKHAISAEIYPMSATQIEWFSSRQALTDGRGILIVLDNKDELSLGWSNVTTAYDVLFIQGTGKIQAIVPDLVLNDLTEPLEITGRIKAVLYLKSGAAKTLDIQPGDRVEHSLFTPAPKILQ